MNTELKRQALKGKIVQENTDSFCFGTIFLTTRTYEVPVYRFNREKGTYLEEKSVADAKRIYNIEVTIDGEITAERWGTSIDGMNDQYNILKSHCEG